MQVLRCNLFDQCKSGDAICVTTNGILNKEGRLVMGAGIARDIRDKFNGVDKILGEYVAKYGNRVFNVGEIKIKDELNLIKTVTLFSFPTKQNWKYKSDLQLIKQSCIQLKQVVEKFKIQGDIYIPAPGCNNGVLDWENEVKPIVEQYFIENKYKICFKIKN